MGQYYWITMRTRTGGDTRGLGQESGNDALLSIREADVVATTSFRRGRLLRMPRRVGRLDIPLDLGMIHLHKGEPPGEVRERALADEAEGSLVVPEGEPNLGIGLTKGITAKVRPEGKVLVQCAEVSVDGLEVPRKRRRQRDKLVRSHDAFPECTEANLFVDIYSRKGNLS